MKVRFKKLSPEAVIPKYATPGSSGFDFVSIEDVELKPGETKLVKTGLAVAVPSGFELQVRPRSGLSLKTPLRVANSPGTVDSDYRGEISVIMTNSADNQYKGLLGSPAREIGAVTQYIKRGDRIAQGVICPVMKAEIEVVEDLDDTSRGAGGFGSTGT